MRLRARSDRARRSDKLIGCSSLGCLSQSFAQVILEGLAGGSSRVVRSHPELTGRHDEYEGELRELEFCIRGTHTRLKRKSRRCLVEKGCFGGVAVQ